MRPVRRGLSSPESSATMLLGIRRQTTWHPQITPARVAKQERRRGTFRQRGQSRRCGRAARRRQHFRAPRPAARHAFHLEAGGAAEPRLLLRTLRSAVLRLCRAGPRQQRHSDARPRMACSARPASRVSSRRCSRALYRHDRVRLSRRSLRTPRRVHVFAALVHGGQRRHGVSGNGDRA